MGQRGTIVITYLTETSLLSVGVSPARRKSLHAKDRFAVFAVALSLSLLAVSFLTPPSDRSLGSQDAALTQTFGL